MSTYETAPEKAESADVPQSGVLRQSHFRKQPPGRDDVSEVDFEQHGFHADHKIDTPFASVSPHPRQAAPSQAPGDLLGGGRHVIQRFAGNSDGAGSETSAVAESITGTDNRTGLPNTLKFGLERLSGLDLSAVRVHRNSSAPSEIGALAFARGPDIHLGPGQEGHLPHEGWHVVQQMQGRVRATETVAGRQVNSDAALETEASDYGARAASGNIGHRFLTHRPVESFAQAPGGAMPVLQAMWEDFGISNEKAAVEDVARHLSGLTGVSEADLTTALKTLEEGERTRAKLFAALQSIDLKSATKFRTSEWYKKQKAGDAGDEKEHHAAVGEKGGAAGVEQRDDSTTATTSLATALAKFGYTVDKKLGDGASAEVYRCVRVSDKTSVAIKCFKSEKEARQEQTILKKVESEGVPKVLALHQKYLVLELIAGKNYKSILSEDGALDTTTAITTVLNVAKTLEPIHEADVAHGDIKAANVMKKDSDGSDVLLDFGYAEELNDKNRQQKTRKDVGMLGRLLKYLICKDMSVDAQWPDDVDSSVKQLVARADAGSVSLDEFFGELSAISG